MVPLAHSSLPSNRHLDLFSRFAGSRTHRLRYSIYSNKPHRMPIHIALFILRYHTAMRERWWGIHPHPLDLSLVVNSYSCRLTSQLINPQADVILIAIVQKRNNAADGWLVASRAKERSTKDFIGYGRNYAVQRRKDSQKMQIAWSAALTSAALLVHCIREYRQKCYTCTATFCTGRLSTLIFVCRRLAKKVNPSYSLVSCLKYYISVWYNNTQRYNIGDYC